MALANKTNYNKASTFFRTLFQDVFQGINENDNYRRYTMEQSFTGTSLEFRFLQGFPGVQDWLGEKKVEMLRGEAHNIPVENKHATLGVSKTQFTQDPNTGTAIRTWLSQQNGFLNEVVVKKLLRGDTDTCYDGQPLFSNSHPNGPDGGTQDNLTTNALTQENYRTNKSTMRAYKDPTGRPLGLRPNLLIVGPAKEDEARDIIEAEDRVVAVDNSGAESGTRVAAASIENVIANDGVQILVEPRLDGGTDGGGSDTTNYWFTCSVSPTRAPMVLGVAEAPNPKDNVDDYHKVPHLEFSIEAQVAVGYGLWQTIIGNLSST